MGFTFDDENFVTVCPRCSSPSFFVDFGISYCGCCSYQEDGESSYSD